MEDEPHTEEHAGDDAAGDDDTGGDGAAINDPLTRSDVEASRAPFEGQKPE